jgi:DnaJ-class molecular chaperone
MPRNCTTCDGSGKLATPFNEPIICKTCNGTKHIGSRKCTDCRGMGVEGGYSKTGFKEGDCPSCEGTGIIVDGIG